MTEKGDKKLKTDKIVIYKPKSGEIELTVRFQDETVWLRQNEIADLFGKDRSVITKHINKIFKDKEISKKGNVHFLHIANSDKPVAFYSLDVVLSVGYRTNSARAINFRQWVTKVLKNYLLQGYAISKRRLLAERKRFKQLQEAVAFLEKKSKLKTFKGQEQSILSLLADYSKTLTLLEQYDKDKLKKGKGKLSKFVLSYQNSLEIILQVKKELVVKKEAGELFGNEMNQKFESVVKNLYQTFEGKQLYKSIEDKSAHLLYLTIKDHPFIDGNKRIASFLFVYFLDKNEYLYRKTGEKKINDNALTALAILIAESQPKEKDQMIALITQLLR